MDTKCTDPPAQMPLGVVLTGGRSSRMGTDKARLRRPDGQLQLAATLDVFQRAGIVARAIAGAPPPEPIPNVAVIPDPVDYAGPLAGIVQALQYAHREQYVGVFVLAVDLPNITSAAVQTIHTQWKRNPQQVTLAIGDGPPEPLIGVYPVAALPSLTRFIESGSRSIMRWLRQPSVCAVAIDPALCLNANTPHEWRAAFERDADR